MRRLNKKKALSLVRDLDAFPKVPESYVETTASGGTVVGADVLDLAETMVASDGLIYEPVHFELSPQQRLWHMTLLHIQERLREEHSLQDIFFKTALKGAPTALPPREDSPIEPPAACRIHGHLYINKVAGNFHITVGKAIPHPRGHAHLAALVSHDTYNFSHRIDHLSFGDEIPGIINPLDGTEKVSADHNHMFQYFITIVPTKLNTYQITADTHQYSVTERERVINHAAGSHGVSGIFMKYDINSLMVRVTEQHMPLWQFLVRLCGIVGGIFSTTGMIHGLVGSLVDVLCCHFQVGVYSLRKEGGLEEQASNDVLLPTGNHSDRQESLQLAS
ncbi:endoplasmic reticulum-Golgi intermediate compartment protein 2 isoform X2 [Lampris incognitus]|uniref:endoplasmic reticulum-Golgi intermediate compartment protein 2 isoform X2 n=1 Tax=Lampris incognitus TaxID=2546036 RepID=UPI0024B4DB1A|nr:endoplasmic reticulum-Golgi intermediate compartment protein 2 isoform X2 [Lampris incognitus]